MPRSPSRSDRDARALHPPTRRDRARRDPAARQQYPIRQYQILDNYALHRGRHAVKLGFEIRRSCNQDVVLDQVSGSFSFSTQPTSFPGNAATGNGLAPLLTGFATGFSENQTDQLRHSYNLETFARDNWTLIRDPTLNLGLRWEIDTPMIDENNRMNSFDLDHVTRRYGSPLRGPVFSD